MIYLYCLTDASAEDLNFLSPEAYGFIIFNEYTIVSSEKNESELISNSCIMEHYDVNNRVMKHGFTVLPFAYGTIIPVDDVICFLEKRRKMIGRTMELLRDKVEMGMKVLIPNGDNTTCLELQKRLGDTPGHRYLSRQVDNYATWFTEEAILPVLRQDIERRFMSISSSIKIKVDSSAERIFMNIAFLIERKRQEQFVTIAKDVKVNFPNCKYLVTGPWPAYNFINLNDDTQSREGVTKWIT